MFFNVKSPQKASKNKIQEKDLDTLFIVAGCPGAGKSTIIRSAYQLDIPLFGEEFHEKFLTTCKSPKYVEYDKYSDAKQFGSIFQARHLKNLKRDPSPPKCLLLHIDLKGVIKWLAYPSAKVEYKKKIKKTTDLPVPHSEMVKQKICDLMVSGYLSNPIFRRYKKILINTVYTKFEDNSRQLHSRSSFMEVEGKPSKLKNLGFTTAKLARRFHREAYKSWNRNLYILKPEQIQFTHVNESGDLLINNELICKNWRSKVLGSA